MYGNKYTDYIRYQDNLNADIHDLIDKCKFLVKQINEEEKINLQAANVRGRKVDLEQQYEGGW